SRETLGLLENTLVTAAGDRTALYARHDELLKLIDRRYAYGSMILTRFSIAGSTISLSRARRRRVRVFPIIPCWPPCLGRRTRPEPVTLKRLAAARFVFIFGIVKTPVGHTAARYHPGGGAYGGRAWASQASASTSLRHVASVQHHVPFYCAP